jgi:hypothetical protein
VKAQAGREVEDGPGRLCNGLLVREAEHRRLPRTRFDLPAGEALSLEHVDVVPAHPLFQFVLALDAPPILNGAVIDVTDGCFLR